MNTYEYTPWGEIRNETETVDNPIKYAGEYYDDELDMIYLRARYYNPQIGRFTSLDIEEGKISNPLDMNRYVYCRNNPIKYIDPSGEAAETFLDVISFGISFKDVWKEPKNGWNWIALIGDTVDFIPFVAGIGETVKATRMVLKTADTTNDVAKLTTKEITSIAKKLGFKKTSYFSHGQAVYKKGNRYITLDLDRHNGGFWKMADSVEGLGSKKTRLGTYDMNLNRIGD